jgi:hypothetical protein
MTGCDQELCPFWDGGGGCPCEVLDITDDERARAKREAGL